MQYVKEVVWKWATKHKKGQLNKEMWQTVQVKLVLGVDRDTTEGENSIAYNRELASSKFKLYHTQWWFKGLYEDNDNRWI